MYQSSFTIVAHFVNYDLGHFLRGGVCCTRYIVQIRHTNCDTVCRKQRHSWVPSTAMLETRYYNDTFYKLSGFIQKSVIKLPQTLQNTQTYKRYVSNNTLINPSCVKVCWRPGEHHRTRQHTWAAPRERPHH